MKSVRHCNENIVISTQNSIILLEKVIVGSGILLLIGITAFLLLFAVLYVV